ncbi:MAG TPA: GNAT family N-acetyltransferase [Pseudoxanthomonas sp.]|nr:GNAT family N-acetyltransferase [Pseudoxanthomonas sp.]
MTWPARASTCAWGRSTATGATAWACRRSCGTPPASAWACAAWSGATRCRIPTWGYALLPEFWGRGYAAEAAAEVLRHAREALGLGRILAITDPANASSMRLLRKLGFVFERMVQMTPDDTPLQLFASTPAGAKL